MDNRAVGASKPKRRKVRYGILVRISLILPALLTGSFAAAAYYGLRCYTNGYYWGGVYMKEARIQPGFDGDVSDLRFTEILTTLDTPAPSHKNLIWAAEGHEPTMAIAFPTRLASNFFPGWGFKDSLGKLVLTSFFGMPLDAKQGIQILHASETFGCGPIRGDVIFDPSPESTPYQVILARVPLSETLDQTVRAIEDRMAAFAQEHPQALFLDTGTEVTIPSVFFRVRDRHQAVGLALNHPTNQNRVEGLVSPSGWFACIPISIRLNRPFLILVRKRGTAEPLMVVWIDNAELISRRPPWWPSVLRAFW